MNFQKTAALIRAHLEKQAISVPELLSREKLKSAWNYFTRTGVPQGRANTIAAAAKPALPAAPQAVGYSSGTYDSINRMIQQGRLPRAQHKDLSPQLQQQLAEALAPQRYVPRS